MQFGVTRRKPGRIEFGIIYGAIALFFLLAARFVPVLAFAPDCAFRTLTGLPCPTCGSTRSVVQLAHGHLLEAFALNPLSASVFLFAVLALIYCAITLLFDLPRVRFTLSPAEKKFFPVLSILTVLANWAYLWTALP